MRSYPVLQNGRFAVIADFERAEHIELFQLRGSSPKARFRLDPRAGRKETGKGCLAFQTGSANDAIIVSNASARNWYLKRDWRDYDLLLASIHSPGSELVLETTISSGDVGDRPAVSSSKSLSKGWNILQFDLAEIEEHIALDDVQEIQFRITGPGGAYEVLIDDLILAGNRFDHFGESGNAAGELYVRVQGRRWMVGAGGRFELTFANGQIVEWYNLARDPNRVHNLVNGTTLGPSPVVMDSQSGAMGDFSALGKAVAASSRLVEANAVRVVMASEWRFPDAGAASGADRPYQRWKYTIYASGQVFVSVEATAATRTWEAETMGLALAVAKPDGSSSKIRSNDESTDSASRGAAYAMVTSEDKLVSFLFAIGDTRSSTRMVERVDDAHRRLTYVAVGSREDPEIARWRAQLFLDSQGLLTPEEGEARADEYGHPPAPNVTLGNLVGPDPSTGFDQGMGCYVLAPDRDRVRFTVGGPGQPRFQRAFKIRGSRAHRVWIYVNHLIWDHFAYDEQGDIIFQLSEPVASRLLVEVLLRPLATSPNG